MSSFSRALVTGLLCLVAACSTTDPYKARAQDLSVQFHQDPPPVTTPSTPSTPSYPTIRGGTIPARVTRDVTPDNPVRILIIGDSLADGFGIFMIQRVKDRGLVANVTNRGKTSTGLSRVDFYDWPSNFAGQAASIRPDIVIAHFGANDDQPIRLPSGTVPYDTPEWEAAYRAQADKILAVAGQYGAATYLLGPAPDRDPHRNAALTKANSIFRASAAANGANFISLPSFTAGPGGEFSTVVNGETIRAGDGSHFTVNGYYKVVDRILTEIERDNPGIFSPPSVEVAGILQ
ncbi:DUF459 domain-containing protein [Pseudoruegeria sp. HB172150]|uniref:SGNH/GDSL hydrolase family protein n=1 Tax=Pseudoruegeria sp. HB172150 TaxID=2721164 RepID=UPI0015553976|nr:DUF459 domain-containing protein [Pseudoruegeria sp. HB172150]